MRIGLLGTGPWAELAYGPALGAHPDVELTGVWGRRPEAAADIAGRFGTRPYRDVDALIADCDAIAVALPPDVQAPLAARAARAGRHLLLDKPVATDVAAAREIAAAVEEAGVASVVFFTMRFRPETAAWIEEQRAVAGWQVGRADWLGGIFGEGAEHSPFANSPWRREKGGLWDVGPHALSVLLPVLGDVADLDGSLAAVSGAAGTVHLAMRHVSGASSTCALSLAVAPAAAVTAVELRGAAGVTAPPEGDTDAVTALGRAVDALLESARTGRPHPCDIRFGVRVTEILAAAQARLDGR
ncbi:gfo/Idh/MocA family oxidoreductase [Streptomyces sp. TRM43335]|uniref:Gfo/Idh/MocA family oxidoreductase n=1 Tax=Streptomyces taklimakanensis TaxID=2569853 RepID=A0A6G2B914_9ACTN|nr:Gfo/Idh/MocA family oxidoreductase [Streptomyces taklimakanensis]MTE18750.1 gfo/Idh/MocA family oxidoreductase [Streptomyces taklimakanensis]